MANILISGYYGFDNLGDELLLTALLQELQQIISPKNQITVLSACPRATATQHSIKTAPRDKPRTVLQALKRYNLLLSGDGSLLQDGTSSRSL